MKWRRNCLKVIFQILSAKIALNNANILQKKKARETLHHTVKLVSTMRRLDQKDLLLRRRWTRKDQIREMSHFLFHQQL
jgi:hypothetical protein